MEAGQIVDQSNIRNFRDFLLQYNKLTENCFNTCISNLNYRKSTAEEDACVDACVNRFVRYNQRAMGTFVEAQLKKRENEAKEAANLPFNLQAVEDNVQSNHSAEEKTDSIEPNDSSVKSQNGSVKSS